MVFLINASNLKAGGGLQVADSICEQLAHFKDHRFVVVLSHFLTRTYERIKNNDNVTVFRYDIPDSFQTIVLGRDKTLDRIVTENQVDAVMTVFGPSRWKPRVPHLSGFAFSQLVIPESPFFLRMSKMELLKWRLWSWVRKVSIKRSADCFWTENAFISERLKRLFKIKEVYTVTNYYNQVFDYPDRWQQSITIPIFDGITCLSVSSPGPHKNLGIIAGILRYLNRVYPGFTIRFVLTVRPENLPLPDDVRDSVICIGKVDISECPNLYQQADIMFMPSLLECFTATYPEAMRMGVPIVTTDLEFAHSLCGNAACYYEAEDEEAAAEAVYRVATDKEYAQQLVENGKRKLLSYDNYEQRAQKLIKILEGLASS